MKCELKRGDDSDDGDDDDYYEETTSPIPDIEDVSHREVERYNHKPVIDLVVLKSEVLRVRVPAGYRGGALKFSEPNMHEVLADEFV